MKNMKYAAALLAYVLVVALFFAAGYGVGSVNGHRRASQQLAAVTPLPTGGAVRASVTADGESPEYLLRLENGSIVLYEVKNGANTRLSAHEISEAVYPREDIAALKVGMIFDNRNEATAMFENFAS